MIAKQTRQAICTLDGSKALQLFFVVSWLFWSGETWDNHQVVENSIFICICKYIPMFVAIKHQPGCQPSISEWLKHAQSPFAYIDVHATVHVGSCGYLSEDQNIQRDHNFCPIPSWDEAWTKMFLPSRWFLSSSLELYIQCFYTLTLKHQDFVVCVASV